MEADCHHPEQKSRPAEHQVELGIWKACAGNNVDVPAVDSVVCYFPQGHMEHTSDPESALSLISHISPTPCVLSRVLNVLYLVDSESDEVFTRIRMQPLKQMQDGPLSPPPSREVVSYAKVLTPSDANNGGGFSVPRFCADSIFPPLDFAADPPVQTLSITDLKGQTWNFRHIYRGTPRRHLLTTGWSKYVNSKKLIAGDSVVFMKDKLTGRLFLGVRRVKKSYSAADMARWAAVYSMPIAKKKKGKVPPESVAQALNLVANRMPFEVVYYPNARSRDFVVPANKVVEALKICWDAGFRVKMAVETEDSSRITWFEGTVTSRHRLDLGTWQSSPWNLLQVAWDEPDALESMKKVSPWQVEYVPQTPSFEAALPLAKRLRLPQNGGLVTEDYHPYPPMVVSESMIGHLNSSYAAASAAVAASYNTIPAGMQGARQNTLSVHNLSKVVREGTRQMLANDNSLLGKAVVLSTDLNIGSSESEVSPDSSSSILSSSPEVARIISKTSVSNMDGTTSLQLFGQTIHVGCNVASLKHAGFTEYNVIKENQGLENPLDDRADVPCSIVPFPLSMYRDGHLPESRN